MNQAAEPKCKCIINDDGGCERCKKELREAVGEMAEAQLQVMKSAQRVREVCQVCHHRYADYAFAAMLPAILERMDHQTAYQVVTQQLKFIKSIGFKSPLIQKVWADHCVAQGWENPEDFE